MKLREVAELLDARVVCGEDYLDRDVEVAFASDLMSDVLTLDAENLLLITGLVNLQAIRTAEMSDVTNIVFVRNKEVTTEMVEVAQENKMVVLACRSSLFRTSGVLYEAGLKPLF